MPRPKPLLVPKSDARPAAGALPFPRPVPPISVPFNLLGLVQRRMCGRWRFEVNVNEQRVLLEVFGSKIVNLAKWPCRCRQTETNVALTGRDTGPGVTGSVMMLVGGPGNYPITHPSGPGPTSIPIMFDLYGHVMPQYRPRKPCCDTDLPGSRQPHAHPITPYGTSEGRFIVGPKPPVTSAP